MNEPRRLSVVQLLAIHSDQVRAHGGSPGVRDRGLLESALNRPRNRFVYESEVDLHGLAAAYGLGVARDHAFIDGKRVAFQAMYVFLGLNGLRIDTSEAEVVAVILTLANGEMDEPELAEWLRTRTVPR